MKLSLTVEADSINVLALNRGRIAVDMDGIELSQLVDAVNSNGCTLRIADEPGTVSVESPVPFRTRLSGLCCNTAHITREDNSLLYALSHEDLEYGNAEWIHYTGSGYLIRLDAWTFPILRLKRLGFSRACRRLLLILMRRYQLGIIHLDAFGELLPDFEVFDW